MHFDFGVTPDMIRSELTDKIRELPAAERKQARAGLAAISDADLMATYGYERKGEEEADPVTLVQASLETLTVTVGEQIAAVEKKASDRFDKLEARIARPNGAKAAEDEGAAIERKAFGTYLRRGDKSIPVDEAKALTVSSDPQGGYLAPADFSSEFIRDLVEKSPLRSLVSVRSTSAPSAIYPRRTGITNAAWHGETETRTESEPAFGQVEIAVKQLSTYVPVSNNLLADSGGSAETEVRLAFADDFGGKETAAFLRGDGSIMPQGIMIAHGVAEPELVPTDFTSTSTPLAGKLIAGMYSLSASYRQRGTWIMGGATLAWLRTLENSAGLPAWQPSLAEGQPEMLLGRPVVEVFDMDIAADGVGAFPIAFGDFNAAYRVVDRAAMSILVDPYTSAKNGITNIHATRRVGGAVIRPDAIVRFKIVSE